MWIQKLGWILHESEYGEEQSILTVDIDAAQLRVLTGGIDNNIGVWRWGSLVDGGKHPTLLALLGEHKAAVNCVRWCPFGSRFASASDDTSILIWEFKGPAISPNLTNCDNLEDWKVVSFLSAHKSDVREIAWSSDGQFLASGSLDNTVLIWKSGQNYPVKCLDGGQVMGLVFDPMSQFLVGLATDTVMSIWSLQDWTLIKRIEGVFRHSSSQPLKRISISPDGRFITTPGPRKSAYKYMASTYVRDTWEVDTCLVGHVQTLSVVKCSPALYRQSNGSVTWCVALGSYDCGVSVWKIGEERPLVVRDIFESAVTDVAWSLDGQHLVASSSDGTVVLIALGGEMGQTLDRTETITYLKQMYGEFPTNGENSYMSLITANQQIQEVAVSSGSGKSLYPVTNPLRFPFPVLPQSLPSSTLPSTSVLHSLPLSDSLNPTFHLSFLLKYTLKTSGISREESGVVSGNN